MKAKLMLMSDGMSKYGHHYGVFDVRMSDGDVYMLGMRDVASGDSKNTLKLLLDVLGDVASVSKGELHETVDKMLVNVKNIMSDRAAAERKFGELLHDYRKKVVPSVVSGWGDMSSEERMDVERKDVPLAPLKGNHFKIAFHNDAGVYGLYPMLKIFFECIKKMKNS